MQRDRFRSLTHRWDEYIRRRRQDGARWRGGTRVWDEERVEVKMAACLKTSRPMRSVWDLDKYGTKETDGNTER